MKVIRRAPSKGKRYLVPGLVLAAVMVVVPVLLHAAVDTAKSDAQASASPGGGIRFHATWDPQPSPEDPEKQIDLWFSLEGQIPKQKVPPLPTPSIPQWVTPEQPYNGHSQAWIRIIHPGTGQVKCWFTVKGVKQPVQSSKISLHAEAECFYPAKRRTGG